MNYPFFMCVLLTVGLIGCGEFDSSSSLEARDGLIASSYTGGQTRSTKDKGKPDTPVRQYTTAGRSQLFKQIQAENQGLHDVELSESITSVKVLNSEKLLALNPNNQTFILTVEIELLLEDLKYKKIEFTLPLHKKDLFLKTNGYIPSTTDENFEAKIECQSSDCREFTIRLSPKQKDQLSDASRKFASALVIVEKPKVEIRSSNATLQDNSAEWDSLLEAVNDKSLTVTQVSYSVDGGVSKTEGSLIRGGEEIAHYLTKRFSTVEENYKPEFFKFVKPVAKKTDQKEALEVLTVGTNSHSGNIAFEFRSKTDGLPFGRVQLESESSTNTDTEFRQEQKVGAPPITVAKPPSEYNNAIVPHFGNSGSDEQRRFQAGLQSYRNNPHLLNAIDVWTGKSQGRKCGVKNSHIGRDRAINFFRKIQPLAPTFLSISKALGTPVDTLYLSAIESLYAVEANNEYVTDDVSSEFAIGPFQIIYSTGKGILKKFNSRLRNAGISMGSIYNVRTQGKVDPRDYRLFPSTSFAAASLLIHENYDWFHYDPAMAIVGYFQGNGVTASLQKCTAQVKSKIDSGKSDTEYSTSIKKCVKNMAHSGGDGRAFHERHKYFNVSLEDVSKFGMGASCEILHYVYSWMALKFIAENPTAYGFKSPSDMNLEGLNPQIYFPGEKLPLTPIDPNTLRDESNNP